MSTKWYLINTHTHLNSNKHPSVPRSIYDANVEVIIEKKKRKLLQGKPIKSAEFSAESMLLYIINNFCTH